MNIKKDKLSREDALKLAKILPKFLLRWRSGDTQHLSMPGLHSTWREYYKRIMESDGREKIRALMNFYRDEPYAIMFPRVSEEIERLRRENTVTSPKLAHQILRVYWSVPYKHGDNGDINESRKKYDTYGKEIREWLHFYRRHYKVNETKYSFQNAQKRIREVFRQADLSWCKDYPNSIIRGALGRGKKVDCSAGTDRVSAPIGKIGKVAQVVCSTPSSLGPR